jgi:hypothetical protein
VLAKHSKSFSLIDCISVGVDRMQRNFEPMRKQVEAWQRSELTDAGVGGSGPSLATISLIFPKRPKSAVEFPVASAFCKAITGVTD